MKLFLRQLALRVLAVMLLLIGVKGTWGYLEYRSLKDEQFMASFALREAREGCGKEPGQKVNINLAPAQELEKLPGIGKVLAGEILRYRHRHGPFRRAEELMTLRGVGGKKFKKLAPMICVE